MNMESDEALTRFTAFATNLTQAIDMNHASIYFLVHDRSNTTEPPVVLHPSSKTGLAQIVRPEKLVKIVGVTVLVPPRREAIQLVKLLDSQNSKLATLGEKCSCVWRGAALVPSFAWKLTRYRKVC